MNRALCSGLAVLATAAISAPALSASHLWRFNELFTDETGQIQFIEMRECCGASSEHALNGKWVLSISTGNQYNFTSNLSGNTANKHLLLATADFAALPGAPTPDFVIPPGIFSTGADTLEYWLYGSPADESYPANRLPQNGKHSMAFDASNSIALATPTNFAGESGTLFCNPADTDNSGQVDVDDLVNVVLNWGPNPGSADVNGDNRVDVDDLVAVITAWGSC